MVAGEGKTCSGLTKSIVDGTKASPWVVLKIRPNALFYFKHICSISSSCTGNGLSFHTQTPAKTIPSCYTLFFYHSVWIFLDSFNILTFAN